MMCHFKMAHTAHSMTRHHGRHDCRLFVPLSCHISCNLGLKFSAVIHIVASEIGWLACELCVQCSREIGSLSTFASVSLYLSLPMPASSWLLKPHRRGKDRNVPAVRLQHRYVGKKRGVFSGNNTHGWHWSSYPPSGQTPVTLDGGAEGGCVLLPELPLSGRGGEEVLRHLHSFPSAVYNNYTWLAPSARTHAHAVVFKVPQQKI